MASRDLADLVPSVREKVERFVQSCAAAGVSVLVYCTYRSAEEQEMLYRQGRLDPGKIVTNARAGESWHQYRRAVDAVPLRSGKPLWKYDASAPEWQVFADQADAVGLEWAGDWKRFREYVHLQDTGGKTIEEARAEMGHV